MGAGDLGHRAQLGTITQGALRPSVTLYSGGDLNPLASSLPTPSPAITHTPTTVPHRPQPPLHIEVREPRLPAWLRSQSPSPGLASAAMCDTGIPYGHHCEFQILDFQRSNLTQPKENTTPRWLEQPACGGPVG